MKKKNKTEAPPQVREVAPSNKCRPCVAPSLTKQRTQSYLEYCKNDAIEYDFTLFEEARKKTGMNLICDCYAQMSPELKKFLRESPLLDEFNLFLLEEICALKHLIQVIVNLNPLLPSFPTSANGN